MSDTPVDVRSVLRAKLQSLSPEARIRMASGMFSGARELGRAGAQAASPGAVWNREQILRYLYSTDLSPAALTAAAQRLRRASEDGTAGIATSASRSG